MAFDYLLRQVENYQAPRPYEVTWSGDPIIVGLLEQGPDKVAHNYNLISLADGLTELTGVVDALIVSGNTSTVTDLIAGNKIARHQNGAGGDVDIDESVTTLVKHTAVELRWMGAFRFRLLNVLFLKKASRELKSRKLLKPNLAESLSLALAPLV